MDEIWLPELIIIFFLLLAIIRPFFKRLKSLDGLVWLPLISFFLTLFLFPAYGFRPECIPLLVFSFFLNIVNIPLLIESAVSGSEEKAYEQSIGFSGIKLIVLIGVIVPVFLFAPKSPLGLITEGVYTRTIRNESAGHDYFLRIYSHQADEDEHPVAAQQPVIFLAPPEAGSVYATDMVCAELADQGFTVISYSRRGLDFPAAGEKRKHYVSPARITMMWQAFRHGTEGSKANDAGKFLESERMKDIEFLLPLICRNQDATGAALIPAPPQLHNAPPQLHNAPPQLHNAPPQFHNAPPAGQAEVPVFFAGYGAAGAAAAFLFEQPGFATRCAAVKGLAVIESKFWTSFQQADTPLNLDARWLPQPGIPVLYLVSDWAFAVEQAENAAANDMRNQYRAVLDTFRNSSSSATLAAFAGAGPFAYNDFSLTRPAYQYLFPGQIKTRQGSSEPVRDAAGYIGNFFISQLSQQAGSSEHQDEGYPSAEFSDFLSSAESFSVDYPPEFYDGILKAGELTAAFIIPEKREITSAVLVERRELLRF